MLTDTTGNTSLGIAASTIVIAYRTISGECNRYMLCKDPVWFYLIVRRSPRWSSGYPQILLAFVLDFDSHRDEI